MSTSFFLILVYPAFTKRPENVTAKAGATAQLVCAAEGEPKPIITWQKHGGFDHFPAAQERRMRVIPEDDHFYIVDVKAADEGVYSCIAKNDAGTVSANVTLTVLRKLILSTGFHLRAVWFAYSLFL